MKLEDFKALKVWQRVVVNGVMDGVHFTNEKAVIVPDLFNTFDHILVRFDDPPASLHGVGDNEWYFRGKDCANFTIEPEHRSTYLNGHSGLKQEGEFVTAWRAVGEMMLTDHITYRTQQDAEDAASKLAGQNAGETVVVLRSVREFTSSAEVTSKTL